MILRRIMIFLVYALLAAHFLRYGNIVLVVLFTVSPFLSLIKHKYAIYVVQTILVLSVLGIWFPTMMSLAQARIEMGLPWLRMVFILLGVMLLTLITAWYAKDLKDKNI